MSDADAIMWTIERDPVLRSTIVAVGVLSGRPDHDAVRRTFERAAQLLPKFGQVVRPSRFGIGRPEWVDAPAFDLDYHVRRFDAPEGADLRRVLDLVAPMAVQDFDRSRPLWEVTVVDGLAGGESVLVLKVHHTVTDGVGGIHLAELLFRETDLAGSAPPPSSPSPSRGTSRSPTDRVVGAVTQGFRVARDPVGTAREIARTVTSIARMTRPVTHPLSPAFRGRGLGRRFDVLDVPLRDLAAIARANGATVNDVFLAAAAGGLARYHDVLGAPTGALRITVPINLRDDDSLGGNRFTPARFVLPISDDPVERVQIADRLVKQWRDEPAVRLTDRLASVLRLLPAPLLTAVFQSMLRNVDVDLVDVPGIRHHVSLGGVRLERLYAFAPPTGTAVSITLLSHVDECCIGIDADTTAVADPVLLTDCLATAFDEMRSLRRGAVTS